MNECELASAFILQQIAIAPHPSLIITDYAVQQAFNYCPQIVAAVKAAADTSSGGGTCVASKVKQPWPIDLDQYNPYNCGYAGGVNPRPAFNSNPAFQLGGCKWNFDDALAADSKDKRIYTRVKFGGEGCVASGTCSTIGAQCGTALDPTWETTGESADNIQAGVCGEKLGYWSLAALCGHSVGEDITTEWGTTITCKILSSSEASLNLFKCKATYATSCHDPAGISATCCGCVDWGQTGTGTTGIHVPYGPLPGTGLPCTDSCALTGANQGPNNDWVNKILPDLGWMKDACPTGYTFPFDDQTTSMKCTSVSASLDYLTNAVNQVNYNIVFCPDSSTTRESIPFPCIRDGHRVIVFTNKCSFSVWPAIWGGATQNAPSRGISNACDRAGDPKCPAGSSCQEAASGIYYCYFSSPKGPFATSSTNAAVGGYKLNQGESLEFHIPIPDKSQTIIWSGGATGRTHCPPDGGRCEVGDCRKVYTNNNYACAPAVGADQPVTQMEFTLEQGVDSYNVGIIDGASFGMVMMPDV